jgi:hypothetical protein
MLPTGPSPLNRASIRGDFIEEFPMVPMVASVWARRSTQWKIALEKSARSVVTA